MSHPIRFSIHTEFGRSNRPDNQPQRPLGPGVMLLRTQNQPPFEYASPAMNETPDGWDPSAVLDRYAALGGDSQSFEFLQLRHFHKDRTYPRFLREIARRVGGEDPAAVQICVDFMIADDPGSESFYVRKTISDRLRKVTLSESQSAALSSHFLTLAAGTARNRGCSMDWRCWRTVINW